MSRPEPLSLGESIVLRAACAEDEPFLREVYASARAEELAQTGLDEAAKRAFLDMQFDAQSADYKTRLPEADFDVVLCEGKPAGRCYVARSKEEIRILDLALLLAHHGAGIETVLLGRLIEESKETKRPLRMFLDNGSREVSLFEGLGFRCVDEQSVMSLYEWRSAAPE